ncbi:transcriptional repressor TraM [Shinella sp. CPCC 101442]|uniref:transcriptional repressor TraM n=1 Tax=Shinella sp. CPCC 101442 TaxID=2932265 RepID=UPI0021521558|nr:transcriptional repressor TraM [Shinella sp. CPCC 101442]MCR6502080.1 transcriptional repressor TraM [Shinella sp. CPCC 101442]
MVKLTEPDDLRALDTAALEKLAVSAIVEHRRKMASDQIVYEEWTRVSDDIHTPYAVVNVLQQEYAERQRSLCEHQKFVSSILDELGYIPTLGS